MTYYSRMFKPQTLVSCLLGKCLYKGTFQRPTALLLHQNSCLPSTHYIPFEDLSFWSTQFFCLAGNSLSKSSKLRFTRYQSQLHSHFSYPLKTLHNTRPFDNTTQIPYKPHYQYYLLMKLFRQNTHNFYIFWSKAHRNVHEPQNSDIYSWKMCKFSLGHFWKMGMIHWKVSLDTPVKLYLKYVGKILIVILPYFHDLYL